MSWKPLRSKAIKWTSNHPCGTFYIQMLSRIQLLVTPWTVACQAPLSMEFSRQENWSELPFLTPVIFVIQGWNLCLLLGRQIWQTEFLPLSNQGSEQMLGGYEETWGLKDTEKKKKSMCLSVPIATTQEHLPSLVLLPLKVKSPKSSSPGTSSSYWIQSHYTTSSQSLCALWK